MKAINLTGQTFGRLRVMRENHRRDRIVFWNCQCKCGNTTVVRTKSLRTGNTMSCGCYRKERAKQANTTHGGASRRLGEHRLYLTWCNMRQRCEYPNNNRYYCYGARGIRVCDAWKDFSVFLHDMEASWKPGLTIERKDNNGYYCKENCLWATTRQQARNTSANHRIEFEGNNMILQDWAKKTGLCHSALLWRIKSGWTTREVLTTPKYERRPSEHAIK